MSNAEQLKRESALEFLEEHDGRHDFLLTELDQLNTRIESILSDYTNSRKLTAQFDAVPNVASKPTHTTVKLY